MIRLRIALGLLSWVLALLAISSAGTVWIVVALAERGAR